MSNIPLVKLFSLLTVSLSQLSLLQFGLVNTSHATDAYSQAYHAMATWSERKKNLQQNLFLNMAAQHNPKLMPFLLDKKNNAAYRCSTQKTAIIDHAHGTSLVYPDGRFVPVKYADIAECFNDDGDLVAVRKTKGGKWGYIDINQKLVIAPQFDKAQEIFDELAEVQVNGKWGYIDTKGSYIIKPQFDEITSPINSAAEAINWYRYGIINTKGEEVVPAIYHDIHYFNYDDNNPAEAIASVRLYDKWGCIDTTGKVVTPITSLKKLPCGYQPDASSPKPYQSIKTAGYDAVWPVSDGMRRVFKDGKYGFINESDELVVSAEYNKAEAFFGGYTLAEKWTEKNEKYFISKEGKVFRPPTQFNADGTEKEVSGIENVGNGYFVVAYDEDGKGFPPALKWLVSTHTADENHVANYVGNKGYVSLENLSHKFQLLKYSVSARSYRFHKTGEVTQNYPPVNHKPINLPDIAGATYVYE